MGNHGHTSRCSSSMDLLPWPLQHCAQMWLDGCPLKRPGRRLTSRVLLRDDRFKNFTQTSSSSPSVSYRATCPRPPVSTTRTNLYFSRWMPALLGIFHRWRVGSRNKFEDDVVIKDATFQSEGGGLLCIGREDYPIPSIHVIEFRNTF